MRRLFAVGVVALLVGLARADTPVIPLRIAGHSIEVEVAHTSQARMQGLMYRTSLPENHGMLFVFPELSRHSMWMVNTFVPLSVAFIDRRGVILNIADMAPQTEDVHTSKGDARYALEMTGGWFARRGIKPGAKVEGLAAAPAAE